MKTKMNRLFGMAVLSGMAGCMALLPPVAEANGGGYESGAAYGNILPFEMEEIGQVAMLEEDLQIDLWTSYADVKVAYKMKNTQNRPVKVRFGFPIEYTRHAEEESVRNYRVSARGSEVAARRVRQDVKPVKQEEQPFKPVSVQSTFAHLDDELEGIESWMVSELEFAPGEELELSISCRVPHLEFGYSVSENVDSYKMMVYRLSSAAVWNGPIRKGKITIMSRSVEADEVLVKAPANRFKREGDAWVWSFENLEPTLADDLSIAVEPDMQQRGSTVVESPDSPQYSSLANRVQKRGSIWMRGLPAEGMKVTASSEQPALPPSAEGLPREFKAAGVLWDGTGERRVWGEGAAGDGTGESITFTLPAPVKLAGFHLVPGCRDLDDKPGLKEYGSVAEMEVIVNETWKKTVVFQPDNLAGRWVSLVQCPEEAKTVRMVIRKVYPGTKHDVTCISDVSFYTLLDKEPKIDPCR